VSDTVSIISDGQALSGWQNVRVTRGIERCPSDFELTLTELYPNQASKISITPGDPITVKLGRDLILTGYVDRYSASISSENHSVTISGRSMVQDLIDCSAKFQTYQISNTTIVGLANTLCKPFGVGVTAPDGDSAIIPQFNVTLTETPYEIIERVARWANFIVFDGTNGNLVIETVGDTDMASGFSQGVNIQAASVSYSADGLYTEIDPVYLSTSFLTNGAPALNSAAIPYIPNAMATYSRFPKRADGNARYRPLLIVSEQSQAAPQLAAQRAQWEMARRVGRSQALHVTCDTWRDSAGTLWTPNAMVQINLPSCKLANAKWLISEVTFNRGEEGTTAELVLMPKTAFIPQPEVLIPFDWQVGQDVSAQGGGAAPAPRSYN
jgi:prophage tail gpP-like protein